MSGGVWKTGSFAEDLYGSYLEIQKEKMEKNVCYIVPFLGNTRVITQNALQQFQDEMGKVMKDPYKVVLKQTKLPITLLNQTAKVC